jgi:hypothetical protein
MERNIKISGADDGSSMEKLAESRLGENTSGPEAGFEAERFDPTEAIELAKGALGVEKRRGDLGKLAEVYIQTSEMAINGMAGPSEFEQEAEEDEKK